VSAVQRPPVPPGNLARLGNASAPRRSPAGSSSSGLRPRRRPGSSRHHSARRSATRFARSRAPEAPPAFVLKKGSGPGGFAEPVWWAVVTVATVGYGDIYPTTVGGRIVAIVLMLAGIGFLAVLTATIASRFVKQERSDETIAITDALARIEAEIAALKARLDAR